MKIYRGIFRGGPEVLVEHRNAMEQVVIVHDMETDEQSELDLYLDVRNHSPTGLSWGYQGSGPNQLALALLIDAAPVEGAVRATKIYNLFCTALISRLPQDEGWVMSSSVINTMAAGIEATLGKAKLN